MPKLVRFVLIHMSYGAFLGIATAIAVIAIRPEAFGHVDGIEHIALVLQLHAFITSFSLGSLATALALLHEP
ncbi:hypothetical protein [Ensifer sp.]|uniref:hypothetical protein n=1 Tax=Ensifer sp. TaxID=1872086 RepID=UPI00289EB627|nr:hypothetical protein [Ensifer sp.]